jgi:hypothetical protein
MITTETKYENLEILLDSIDINIIDFINESDLEDIEDAQDLFEELSEQYAFDVEIIYYTKAMDYLRENDTSLTESFEIASELGYEVENLNSETLASLHASRKLEEDFWDIAEEIDEILQD